MPKYLRVVPLPTSLAEEGVERVKPQEMKIKINVDTALFEDRGQHGFGMVARMCCGAGAHRCNGFREALSWMKQRQWGGCYT